MSYPANIFIGSCFTIVLCVSSLIHGAEHNDDPEQELEQINSAIAQIQSWLTEANSQQTAQQQMLGDIEITISETSLAIGRIQQSIDQLEDELSELSIRSSELN
jgi:septal ring factor EnvC (AmiA/AmiB activator)